MALEQPGEAAGRGGLQREGRQQLAGVAELRQHHPAALDGQRATAVTVVAQRQATAAAQAEKVLGHHHDLLARRRRGLRVGGAADIAEGEDLAMADMLQGRRVDFAPAGRVAQAAGGDEGRRQLRRHHVQQVEVLFRQIAVAVGVLHLEPGLARRAVDLHQVGIERQLGRILAHVFHQRRNEIGDAEQRRAGQVELDLDVLQHALPQPVVAGQVHGFLRRPGALDRHRRLGEQRLAATQAAHQLPGVGRQVVAVVGGDAVAPEGLLQALDALPGQAQAGADDQVAVFQAAAALQQ
ncbi:Uncharacterised protein [Enterobacter cloacae]|nr:Uncharacterised protein [Enterobacter cloacae]